MALTGSYLKRRGYMLPVRYELHLYTLCIRNWLLKDELHLDIVTLNLCTWNRKQLYNFGRRDVPREGYINFRRPKSYEYKKNYILMGKMPEESNLLHQPQSSCGPRSVLTFALTVISWVLNLSAASTYSYACISFCVVLWMHRRIPNPRSPTSCP